MENNKVHLYQIKGHSIGKWRCLTLPADRPYDKAEKMLAGPNGTITEFIRENGSKYYAVWLVLSRDFEHIREKKYWCDSKDLAKWVLRIKLPTKPEDQLKWANNPDSRLD